MGVWAVWQCRIMSGFFTVLALMLATVTWAMVDSLTLSLIAGILVFVLIMLSMLFWDMSRLEPADSHSLWTMVLQYLLMSIFVTVGSRVYKKMLSSCNHVQGIQEKVLMNILWYNRKTMYAENHSLKNGVRSREAYVNSHPLTQYHHYGDYIAAIERGEQNVLTKDPVVFLALTSGTTGRNKHIPITGDMKGPSAHRVGPLMYACMHQKAGLTLQRVLVLSYKSRVTESAGGLRVGPVSAHMSRYVPFMVGPREAYDVVNEQAALHIHAVFGFQETEVGHIEALMSTLVYSFWRYVENHWHSICDDIENGIISHELSAPEELLAQISAQLRPDPARAAELRSHFTAGFDSIAVRVWPGLKFVRTLTTGGFALHAQFLSSYYMRGVKLLSLAHVASEGFMGFNLNPDPDVQTYTAMTDYAFMEFIPISQSHLEQPQTCFLEQLQLGEEYEVVMTTPMGLHRYRTGDVIKVVDHVDQCPVYEFQYRLGQILNLYWEKTHEAAMFEAITRALSRLSTPGVRLVDYTAAEDVCVPHVPQLGFHSKKHYVLFIEVEGPEGQEVLLSAQDKAKFDETLCEISELYALIRESDSAEAMVVVQVYRGTFLRMKASMINLTQSQQYKCPRVMRRYEYINLLLEESYK